MLNLKLNYNLIVTLNSKQHFEPQNMPSNSQGLAFGPHIYWWSPQV